MVNYGVIGAGGIAEKRVIPALKDRNYFICI